jgi:hypothetical protein
VASSLDDVVALVVTSNMEQNRRGCNRWFSKFSHSRAYTDSHDLILDRFKAGIVGGVTMGAMHSLSNKISTFTGASERDAGLLNKAVTTGIAGAGGGVVGFGANALLDPKSFDATDFEENYDSAKLATAERRKEYDSAFESRRLVLENRINTFLSEQDLSKIVLKTDGTPWCNYLGLYSGGMAWHGMAWHGMVIANERFDNDGGGANKNVEENLDTLDEEESEEHQKAQQVYEQRIDDLIDDVLLLRKGQHLSPDERIRAEKLASESYGEKRNVEELKAAQTQDSQLFDLLEGPYPKAIYEFLELAVSNPEKLSERYGIERISPAFQNLIDQDKNQPYGPFLENYEAAFDSATHEKQEAFYEQLGEKLKPMLEHQRGRVLVDIEQLEKRELRKYHETILEREAFPTGILTQLTLDQQQS